MRHQFAANIEIIGVNPFVYVPHEILSALFITARKNKGFIPICGTLNKIEFKQTLVKFKGEWRLYVNTSMLKNSPKRIGEKIDITLQYDDLPRLIVMPQKFKLALKENIEAQIIFDELSPSKKTEIVRYLARLKNDEVLEKNIFRAINFLLGKESFVGRAKP